MMTAIPDPQSLKQVIDCIGYSVMGLAGVFSAWQRMKGISNNGANAEIPPTPKPKLTQGQRLERVEHEIVLLKNKQAEMYEETLDHQKSMLQQQAAVFNLLIQQRSAIDKILGKMGGM